MALSADSEQFGKDLADLISSTIDTSLRDGNQSLYATSWKKDDLLAVAEEFEKLAKILVEDYDKPKPVMETAGGTIPQISMRNHGMAPHELTETYEEVMPHVRQRDLNRGGSGYALKTQPEEIREELINGAMDAGVDISRIFDFMGDPQNIEPTAKAINERREIPQQFGVVNDKLPEAEIAICYTGGESDKPDNQRVKNVQDYIDMGVSYIEKGLGQRLALKDYGGFAPKEEMVAIVEGWREKLGSEIPITMHSHGERAEDLSACLDAGGANTYVDTGIGKLSGEHAHTNLRDLIDVRLKEKYDLESDDIKNHPLMQQIERIEQTIACRAELYKPFKSEISCELRDALDKGLIAGGGIQATINAGKAYYPTYAGMAKQAGIEPLSVEDFIIEAMNNDAPQLWEAAGRFDTVTPGTKILSDTAYVVAAHRLTGNELSFKDSPQRGILQPYADIVKGKFGYNIGLVDKGIGKTSLPTIANLIVDIKGSIDEQDATSQEKELTEIKNAAQAIDENSPYTKAELYQALLIDKQGASKFTGCKSAKNSPAMPDPLEKWMATDGQTTQSGEHKIPLNSLLRPLANGQKADKMKMKDWFKESLVPEGTADDIAEKFSDNMLDRATTIAKDKVAAPDNGKFKNAPNAFTELISAKAQGSNERAQGHNKSTA